MRKSSYGFQMCIGVVRRLEGAGGKSPKIQSLHLTHWQLYSNCFLAPPIGKTCMCTFCKFSLSNTTIPTRKQEDIILPPYYQPHASKHCLLLDQRSLICMRETAKHKLPKTNKLKYRNSSVQWCWILIRNTIWKKSLQSVSDISNDSAKKISDTQMLLKG